MSIISGNKITYRDRNNSKKQTSHMDKTGEEKFQFSQSIKKDNKGESIWSGALKNIDLFGEQVNLKVYGLDKVKSAVGGICSIFLIVCVCVIMFVYFSRFFTQQDPQIQFTTSYQKESFVADMNVNQIRAQILIYNFESNLFQTYTEIFQNFRITAELVNDIKSNIIDSPIIKYPMVQCSEVGWKDEAQTLEYLPQTTLDKIETSGVCMESDSLQKVREESINNRTEIRIYWKDCPYSECPYKGGVNLEYLELEYWIFDTQFRPQNYADPLGKKWSDEGWMNPLANYTLWSSVYQNELVAITTGYWNPFGNFWAREETQVSVHEREMTPVPKLYDDDEEQIFIYWVLGIYAGHYQLELERAYWDLFDVNSAVGGSQAGIFAIIAFFYQIFGMYHYSKTINLDMIIDDDSEFPDNYKQASEFKEIYWKKWRNEKKREFLKCFCCVKKHRSIRYKSDKRIYEAVEQIMDERLDVKNLIQDQTEFQIIKKLFLKTHHRKLIPLQAISMQRDKIISKEIEELEDGDKDAQIKKLSLLEAVIANPDTKKEQDDEKLVGGQDDEKLEEILETKPYRKVQSNPEPIYFKNNNPNDKNSFEKQEVGAITNPWISKDPEIFPTIKKLEVLHNSDKAHKISEKKWLHNFFGLEKKEEKSLSDNLTGNEENKQDDASDLKQDEDPDLERAIKKRKSLLRNSKIKFGGGAYSKRIRNSDLSKETRDSYNTSKVTQAQRSVALRETAESNIKLGGSAYNNQNSDLSKETRNSYNTSKVTKAQRSVAIRETAISSKDIINSKDIASLKDIMFKVPNTGGTDSPDPFNYKSTFQMMTSLIRNLPENMNNSDEKTMTLGDALIELKRKSRYKDAFDAKIDALFLQYQPKEFIDTIDPNDAFNTFDDVDAVDAVDAVDDVDARVSILDTIDSGMNPFQNDNKLKNSSQSNLSQYRRKSQFHKQSPSFNSYNNDSQQLAIIRESKADNFNEFDEENGCAGYRRFNEHNAFNTSDINIGVSKRDYLYHDLELANENKQEEANTNELDDFTDDYMPEAEEGQRYRGSNNQCKTSGKLVQGSNISLEKQFHDKDITKVALSKVNSEDGLNISDWQVSPNDGGIQTFFAADIGNNQGKVIFFIKQKKDDER